jgi:segregation and condensation protein A
MQLNLEHFSGPYELLLKLIEDKKLDITELALSEVTGQFLQYIEENKDDVETMPDFLVVASRLLLLKSRSILPVIQEDEEDETLEEHLKMYKIYAEACDHLTAQMLEGRVSLPRQKMTFERDIVFIPPQGVSLGDLPGIYGRVLKRLEPVVKFPKAIIDKTVTLQEKVNHIKELLHSRGELSWATIHQSGNKTDRIVSFLAILELSRSHGLTICQDGHCENILIKKS